MRKNYEILMVGGGPAGISMAVEARFAGIPTDKVLVVEKADHPCWSICKFYPDNKIVTANYKGFDNVIHDGVMRIMDLTKPGTIAYFHEAILENDLNINYSETVHTISRTEESGFIVTTDQREYRTRVCVIAIGILGRPNRPGYRLPRSLRERIHFNIPPSVISGSNVLLVGGGDSAAEQAIHFRRMNNRMTLCYRGDSFHRMNDENRKAIQELEQSGELLILRNSDLVKVENDAGRPLVRFLEEDHKPMTFDYIIYCIGGTTPTNFLKNMGIDFHSELPVMGDGFETSIPGLFLAGDLTAGVKGGSINWAFAASRKAMLQIAENYLTDVAAGA